MYERSSIVHPPFSHPQSMYPLVPWPPMPFDAGLQLPTLHGPQICHSASICLRSLMLDQLRLFWGWYMLTMTMILRSFLCVYILWKWSCVPFRFLNHVTKINKVYTELHGNPAHVVSVSSVETILVPHALIRCLSQTTLTRSQKLLVWHSVQVWALIIHSERSSVRYNSSTGNKVTSRRIPYWTTVYKETGRLNEVVVVSVLHSKCSPLHPHGLPHSSCDSFKCASAAAWCFAVRKMFATCS